jgi:uncharacterized surface protein with fasciclin (FAS1) repeats
MRAIASLSAALAAAVLVLSPAAKAAPPGPTIVDVAVAANSEGSPFEGQLDSLVTAVLNADPIVLDTLSGNGQFTVFAPTDGAFEAIGLDPDAITALAADPEGKALLTDVLLYHVAHGRRDSGAVLGSERIRVLKGGFVFQSGGMLTDNNDREVGFVFTDVPAANGIIHVINTVLLP